MDWTPLYLSCIAGASTCIGAAVVFLHPKDGNNRRKVSESTMSFSLALAGSVMITVSVMSISAECLEDPSLPKGSPFRFMSPWSMEFLQRVLAFVTGGVLYFALSCLAFPEADEILGLPKDQQQEQQQPKGDNEMLGLLVVKDQRSDSPRKNSGNIRSRKRFDAETPAPTTTTTTTTLAEDVEQDHNNTADPASLPPPTTTTTEKAATTISKKVSWARWIRGADLGKDEKRAWRVAMLLFVSLMFHNFPEGLAVAASALESTKLGVTVCIGIFIHNIPEGIAISIPCLAARPDYPLLSFGLASLSGLAEPLGAFVAMLCLKGVEGRSTAIFSMKNVLAFVAGIMVTVALYELFPEARRHTSQGYNAFVSGAILGVVIMVVTELIV